MGNRLDLHIPDLHFDIPGFLFVFPLYGQHYGIFLTVTDHGSNIGSFFVCNISSIYCLDHISLFQSRLFSRATLIKLYDLCPSGVILLKNGTDPYVGAFIGSIQLFILFCCVIGGVRILQAGKQASIKPLTQAAFVFFIQIFFIDQFFQVIQLLNRFHIGKHIAVRKQYFLIAGKNSACHNQRCCHSNGYTFFEFFIFHIFPFFCTAGKADKITDFLYSSVRRSVFIYRKRLPIFRQPLYIL